MRSNLAWVLLCCTACVAEGTLKQPEDYFFPQQLDDGWTVGDAQAQGVRTDTLRSMFDAVFSQNSYPGVTHVVVIANGVLVAEGSVQDANDGRTPAQVMEITGMVTAMALGAVQGDGKFTDANATLQSIFSSTGAYGALSLHDLLTMRAGIAFGDTEFTQTMEEYTGTDSLGVILSKPQDAPFGSTFAPRLCNAQVISSVVQALTGMPLYSYAVQQFLLPMSIASTAWFAIADGTTYGGEGLLITARDLAKFGQLILNGGIWHGASILPSAWIDTSTQTYVPSTGNPGEGYGYFWYTYPERNALLAVGHGGQYVYIDRNNQLVLAVTGLPHSNHAAALQRAQLLEWAENLVP